MITAIFVSSKLKTVTNHFIMSLAVSDLLLGLAIIPYSLCLAVIMMQVFVFIFFFKTVKLFFKGIRYLDLW